MFRGGLSCSVVRIFPTKAFLMLSVKDRSNGWMEKSVKSRNSLLLLSKVVNLQGCCVIVASMLAAMVSSMAELVAAESIIAYVAIDFFAVLTMTGTMGLMTGLRTYAAASHAEFSSSFDSFS